MGAEGRIRARPKSSDIIGSGDPAHVPVTNDWHSQVRAIPRRNVIVAEGRAERIDVAEGAAECGKGILANGIEQICRRLKASRVRATNCTRKPAALTPCRP